MTLRFFQVVLLFVLVFTCCDSDKSSSSSPVSSGFDMLSYVQSEGAFALSEAEALLSEDIETPDGSDLCKKLDTVRADFRSKLSARGIRANAVTVRFDGYTADDAAKDRAEALAYDYSIGLKELSQRCWNAVENNRKRLEGDNNLDLPLVTIDPSPNSTIENYQEFKITFTEKAYSVKVNGLSAEETRRHQWPAPKTGKDWKIEILFLEGEEINLTITWTDKKRQKEVYRSIWAIHS